MSQTIKVSPEVYQGLRDMQAPRESYSDVIVRLIDVWRALNNIKPILAGMRSYHEFEKNRDKAAPAAPVGVEPCVK